MMYGANHKMAPWLWPTWLVWTSAGIMETIFTETGDSSIVLL